MVSALKRLMSSVMSFVSTALWERLLGTHTSQSIWGWIYRRHRRQGCLVLGVQSIVRLNHAGLQEMVEVKRQASVLCLLDRSRAAARRELNVIMHGVSESEVTVWPC